MVNKKVGAGLTVLAGVGILIWWVQNWAIGLVDCWIGEICTQIMIPALLGFILVVAGMIVFFKQ